MMKVFSPSLAGLFLFGIGLAALLGKLSVFIAGVYFVLSLLTFAMYWKDKQAARTNTQRTPENTLHVLAVLGGWPGALIGQQMLRHKTQKISFRIVLWLSILLNIALLVAILYGVKAF